MHKKSLEAAAHLEQVEKTCADSDDDSIEESHNYNGHNGLKSVGMITA